MYVDGHDEGRCSDLRCLEAKELRVADHDSQQTASQISYVARLFILMLLVESKNALVSL